MLKRHPFILELALKSSEAVGAPLSLFLSYWIKSYIMHRLRNHQEARESLAHAFRNADQMKSKLFKFYVLQAKALFAFDEGDDSSGIPLLQSALALGREEGYTIHYINQPFGSAKLCVKALEAGIEVEYVQELIRKLTSISRLKLSLYLKNWPWSLKIYTLGRFKLLKDGNPVQFSRKAQQKPLALLKALIAFGGKEVREDQIQDTLWPEADGDSAHHSFEMTLHRLRTLIGRPETLEFQEGRLSLDPRYYWVDVWAFEHLLEEADTKREKGLTERSVELTQKAMEMYKGPFLSGEVEQPWVISIRERLRRKFLRNVSWLGHYWEQHNQWEKTLECYERGTRGG